jgi:hypothetical protein
MQRLEKCSSPFEGQNMDSSESNRWNNLFFGSKMIFFSFVVVTGANFVLLLLIRRQHRKELS